jgi:two-component system LytT family sensor kinase
MFVSTAWIVPAVFGAVNEIAQPRLLGGPPVRPAAVLFASGDWLLYAFLTPAVFAISHRWPLSRHHLVWRVSVQLAFSLLFCVAWASAGMLLRLLLERPASLTSFATQFLSWLFITFPFGVAVYLSVVGIEHAIRYFVEAREHEVQLAQLSEQLAGARFAALQAQLNPHFLFNTLNTIAVLVRDDDRKGAVRIVEQLSDVLRRTLRRHQTNEVALGEELELVRQYLAIEQARFSDRLHATIEVDDSIRSAKIPSFALQHLVENAVRHGMAKSSDARQVLVTARRDGDELELSVIDDGPGFDREAMLPKGHGIENTRERLSALYGERASLVVRPGPAGGTIARLRVPYGELNREARDADQ